MANVVYRKGQHHHARNVERVAPSSAGSEYKRNISILLMVVVSCIESGQGQGGGDKGEAVGKRETRLF